MSEKIRFWTFMLKKEIILKLIIYFVIMPIGVIGAQMIGDGSVDSVINSMCFFIIPILSCWGMMLFLGEVTYGSISEYTQKDYFNVIFLLIILLVNILLLFPLKLFAEFFVLDYFDECVALSVCIFFMSGLVVVVTQISHSTAFAAICVLGYMVLNIINASLEDFREKFNMFSMMSLNQHAWTDSIYLDFIIASFILWIIGITIILKRKRK